MIRKLLLLFIPLCVILTTVWYFSLSSSLVPSLFAGSVEDSHRQTKLSSWLGKAVVVSRESCTMETRIRRMSEQCEKMQMGENLTVEEIAETLHRRRMRCRFYVDDQHKVVYCPISKTASTSFRHLMMQAAGEDIRKMHYRKAFHKLGLGFLCDDYTSDEISYRLKNYLKFIVVRHPMDRLVSVYNHRILVDWKFPLKIGEFSNLTQRYFNNSLNTNPENIMDFSQFITLLSKEPKTFRNPHWETVMHRCHPCEIKYNYIMRFETLNNDIPTLLERLGNPTGNVLELPEINRRRRLEDKLSDASKAFRDININTIRMLMENYGHDLDVFGYTWHPEDGASCTFVTEDGECC